MMDRLLRQEIMEEVRRSLRAVREEQEERWVTASDLISHCGMFTKDWLKRYGHSLPRAQAVVIDEQGQEHKTGFAYPLYRIERMIATGEIRRLRCRVVNMAGMKSVVITHAGG